MFYAHEVRNCCVIAIFERRRGRLGSKISGYGQLAEVAVYFAMSRLPPEADTNRKGRHVRWGRAGHAAEAGRCRLDDLGRH